jgi:prolyl 4-hydroxylase
LPLVSSAIINVAQDVDEAWPLEVYSHDGKAYNVTMEPGDMVLYESHTVIHGRPFAMKGKFFVSTDRGPSHVQILKLVVAHNAI